MKVEFTFEALADVNDAALVYLRRSTNAFAQFNAAMDSVVDRLEQFPGVGTTGPEGTRKILVARFPYFVRYLVGDENVLVIAVTHTNQRDSAWLGRLN